MNMNRFLSLHSEYTLCLSFKAPGDPILGGEYDYGGAHNGLGLPALVKNDLCERACLCRTNSIKSTHTLPPMQNR